MDILQVIISGILLGGIYGLISMGLTMIFGVIKIINFAHGEFLMLSMYTTFWLVTTTGVDPYIMIPVVALVMFAFGCLIMRGLQPMLESPATTKMLATIGISMVLQNVALLLWSADYRNIHTPYSTATISFGTVQISVTRLIVFIAVIITATALYYFLQRSMLGKAIRATAQDRRAAMLMGINIYKVYLIAFGIGSALAGIAGTMLLTIYSVFPSVGTMFSLVAFVVIVLGGLGNMIGALLGGLIIGLVEGLSGVFITPALKEAVYFLIFIFVLLLKPSGLLGLGRGTEEVGLK